MNRRNSSPPVPEGPHDAIVAGGGVVGLSCAWRLAAQGLAVTVVDPGKEAERATWAAGGMLAPMGEAPEPGPFLALGMRSLGLFPEFVARLEEASGRSVGLHLDGKLLTATSETDVQRLGRRRDWLSSDGHPVRWLSGDEVRALEPAVSREVQAGLLLEGNGRVDNRALQAVLEMVCREAGVRFVRDRVAGLSLDSGRLRGVELAGGERLQAPCVLLSAGAWSGGIAGLPRPLPVRPVKGEMLAFATPGRPLSRVVISTGAYLIPRETPRGPVIVVGATSHEAGFDLSVSPAGQATLERGAVELVPALGRASVAERWAGLRPGIRDDLPVLGPDPEVAGLYYATGHYRNGVLLAPVTAELLAGWMTGNAPAGLDAFAPGRFTT